jgi:hypothetical protein
MPLVVVTGKLVVVVEGVEGALGTVVVVGGAGWNVRTRGVW